MNSNNKNRRIFSPASLLIFLAAFALIVMTYGCGSEERQNLSGQVTLGGTALPGVKINMTGSATAVAVTDANGRFSFGNVSSGQVTLAPSLAGYLFSPPSRTAILLGVDLAGFSFNGFISGRLATIYHSVYVKSDGTLWSWGANNSGQLGNGTKTDRLTPAQVPGMTGITALAAGLNHTVALKSDGTLWAWGSNSNGQLGDGTTTDKATPVQVSGLTGVIAVDAGTNHTVALKNDGTLWAWGSNSNGQLGDGTKTDRSSPVQVINLTSIITVAAGDKHTVAIKSINPLRSDGIVWAWGANNYGQLGDGSKTDKSTPVQVAGLIGITDIAVGDNHNIALRNIYTVSSDGTLWAWGANGSGQLGDGTIFDRTTPMQVAGLSLVTTIAAGSDHSIALRNNGMVWTWGANTNGQLGDGTTVQKITAIQVGNLTGVTAIAAGYKNNIVSKTDGTLRAWGYNNKGQLGDGTTVDKLIPTAVLMP